MPIPQRVKWIFGGLAILGLVVILLGGIGLSLVSSRVSPVVQIGEPLPSIQLTAFDGAPIDLNEYKGQVVILELWSSW